MQLFAYSRTQAGIERLARQRQAQKPTAVILPFKPRSAPPQAPLCIPSTHEVSRARHMAFLASIDIATKTPVKLLIERVAAWYGLAYIDIIGLGRTRICVAARDDAIRAVFDANPDATQPWLGKQFLRDHTTVRFSLLKTGSKTCVK